MLPIDSHEGLEIGNTIMNHSDPARPPQAPDADVALNLLGQLEQRMEQIKQRQDEQDRFFKLLDTWSQQLDQEQQSIEQLSLDTAEQRQRLDNDKTQLGAETADLARQRRQAALRRARIDRGRRMLREQRRIIREQEQSLATLQRQHEGVVKQRTMLIEAAELLAAGETRMVQRWATNRAASVATLVAIFLVLAAGFSFVLGRDLTEPIWRATAVLALDVSNSKDNATLHCQ